MKHPPLALAAQNAVNRRTTAAHDHPHPCLLPLSLQAVSLATRLEVHWHQDRHPPTAVHIHWLSRHADTSPPTVSVAPGLSGSGCVATHARVVVSYSDTDSCCDLVCGLGAPGGGQGDQQHKVSASRPCRTHAQLRMQLLAGGVLAGRDLEHLCDYGSTGGTAWGWGTRARAGGRRQGREWPGT